MQAATPVETIRNPGDSRASALAQLANRSPEYVCRFDPATGEVEWFDDLGLALGYDPGTLAPPVGMLTELVPPGCRAGFREEWRRVMEEGRGEFDLTLTRRGGESRQFHARLVREAAGAVWVLALRDVHEARVRAGAEADRLRVRTVETMAAGLSHELNNYLTPVRGFIELALEEMTGPSSLRSDLELALRQVENCRDLIEHLQSYGGKVILNPRPTEVVPLTLSFVRSALALEKNDKGVQVEEYVDGEVPNVNIDHASYRKAVTHVVRNAVATMPRDARLRVRVEVVPDAPVPEPAGFGYVRVSFEDNGAGMDADTLRRIREPFFTTHGRARARGLGVPMVQGVVEKHGGCLDIVSVVGRGTKVSLYFPIPESSVRRERAAEGPEDGVPVAPAAPVGRMLVADDEDIIRRLIGKVFGAEGWMIREAHDYSEVLRVVEDAPQAFDLLLLDVTMPGPPAEEAIGRLRAAGCRSEILIVTGRVMDARLEALLRLTGGQIVHKPFSPKTLLSKVDEVLLGTAAPG